MKTLLAVLTLSLMSFSTLASQNQSYKLITVSTYLNFYLLNLNACEDFHPSVRQAAYQAEAKLYPYFEKLDVKVAALDIDADDKKAIANTVIERRGKLNAQIEEGEFTVEHCKVVINIVNEGLDKTILESVN